MREMREKREAAACGENGENLTGLPKVEDIMGAKRFRFVCRM